MHIYLFIYLLFSAGDGRWRHHRCIPAADRRSLLNPPHLVGSHPKIFPSVTFTVPLLVSDYYYYNYCYSSLHLKKFFMVPSWCSMGLINVLSQTELNFVHVNSLCWPIRATLSSGTASYDWTNGLSQLLLVCQSLPGALQWQFSIL